MRDIRIIALDLDDTLLKGDLTISDTNRKAIREAEQSGVYVILASGRIPFAMEPYIKALGMDTRMRLCICNNGAEIIRSDTGELVYEAPPIPIELGKEVFTVVQKEGFPVELYDGTTIYVSEPNVYTEKDLILTGTKLKVTNIAQLLERPQRKMVIPGDPDALKRLEAKLKEHFNANIFISKPYFLEVLSLETDKGTALSLIAKHLGIQRDQVLAIGDSMNDLGMIRYAGIGVAMANAVEAIKEAADVVTTRTNEEDGVAEVIDRFIFSRVTPETCTR
ncbi:MAG TPA: Cof-type HAD-IIB family hydrolase [Spirochaetia bacterium]|mgnify:CR=1 FL=1|nr:Cof-type HAD-IIB family hydrolase [Spirochaetia bacterium]